MVLPKQGAGTLTLTGLNTYTGATTITGGILDLTADNVIAASSGVTLNGATAQLLYNNTVAPFGKTVTAINGSVAGFGVVDNVVVPTGGNLNATGVPFATVKTINTLSFSGAGAMTIIPPSQFEAGLIVDTVNTGAVGNKVTINASSPNWTPGLNYLVNYVTLAGSGTFQVGTIAGLTRRQTASVSTSVPNYISLNIIGDNPAWTGHNPTTFAELNDWVVSVDPGPYVDNWQLIYGVTPTHFYNGDVARFDDTPGNYGSATATVNITAADVAPASVVFENTYLPYVFNGTKAIAGSTSVAVNNTGSVTLNNSNSYTGGTTVKLGTLTLANANTTTGATTITSGTLNINHASALGTGALIINGGTIDNTSVAPVTLATTNAISLGGDFAFGGTNNLNLGTNNVVLTGTRTITTNDPMSAGTKLVVGSVISGAFGLNKDGPGKMVISGANTYTGMTSVNNGTLEVAGGSIGVAASTAPNIQIGPTAGSNGTLLVSGGTVYADRLVISGNTANNDGGTGTLTQTGGTIWAREWFTVGSIGTGTYNISGGTMNLTGQNFEVGNFTSATGIVNLSGTGAINLYNNRPIYLGANPNATLGKFNQNGGTVTFYSNAGTTVGGTGVLGLGNSTGGGSFDYWLNGGTLTVPQIQKSASALGNFHFNGGTLKAARNNGSWMQNLSGAEISDGSDPANPGPGGAYIDSNGFNVTIGQGMWGLGKLVKQGSGTLTLSGSSSYAGVTEVTGGTLLLNDTGDISGTSGITINGSGAKFVQANTTTPVAPPVTVQTGTLDGIGTVNTVTVPDGTGGIIANGNGSAAALTIGSLTFNGIGTASLNTTPDTATTPVLLTTNLATGGKPVTINVSASNWYGGQTYDLISYASSSGSLADFTKGTVTNLTPRQTATLTTATPGMISLSIVGADNIKWSGASDGNWTTNAIPDPKNWLMGVTTTDFINTDAAVFDDTASTTSPSINDANVSPIYTLFNNNAKSYTLSSTGAFGIASGYLTKSGTGELTISNANTYAGGTILNSRQAESSITPLPSAPAI